MKIETLNEFIILIKHQNYSHAAKELFLSQPGLSNHIANLEKELGFKLIERHGNRLSLTLAGAEFLKNAQQIVDTYDRALKSSRALIKENPPVRVMSVATNASSYKTLLKVTKTPFVFVDVDPTITAIKAIEKNLVDIAFAADFSENEQLVKIAREAGIEALPATMGSAAVCFMKTHPLAEKSIFNKQDLKGSSVMIFSGQHFDIWKSSVLRIFGEESDFNFILDPVESLSNINSYDFKDSIYICGRNAMNERLSHRDDIVIFDEVDGVDMSILNVMLFKEAAKDNVVAFIEEIKPLLANEKSLTDS